jgi:hypothetical protein
MEEYHKAVSEQYRFHASQLPALGKNFVAVPATSPIKVYTKPKFSKRKKVKANVHVITSVAEPYLQGAASFCWSRTRCGSGSGSKLNVHHMWII